LPCSERVDDALGLGVLAELAHLLLETQQPFDAPATG
jgi:hypothetical protein